MEKQNLDRALADLAEQARRDSIGSIDHLANAKAIALGDPKVQEALKEVLARGLRLTEIRPLRGFGSALMSFPLQLVFRSGQGDSPIDLAAESLVVTVELPTRSVKRVVAGPAETEAARDVPFAIAATARPPYTGVPLSELEGRNQRERVYFENLGLPDAARTPTPGQWTIDDHKTTDSATGSETGSESYSNGVADDSEPDDTGADDQGVDDHVVEGHPGDPASWSPFDPGRPFVSDPPRGPGGWPWPAPPRDPIAWRRR